MSREGDRDTMVMWSAWELTSNFSKAPMDSTDITVPETPRITCNNTRDVKEQFDQPGEAWLPH